MARVRLVESHDAFDRLEWVELPRLCTHLHAGTNVWVAIDGKNCEVLMMNVCIVCT